ncbi:hypothetical protein ACFP4G_04410 [Fodinicurvata halophila]|uniref:hypothetical protein n=1 Tax=Fodinicurvata halophila TaxID=1419723 RepID=UPI0036182D34
MNRTAIAKACGFNRSVLYDNEDCARMLAEAHSSETRKTPGSAHDDPTGKQLQALENQVQHLETRVACLAAENADLRLKLKRAKAVADELVADGKRIAPYESGGTQ